MSTYINLFDDISNNIITDFKYKNSIMRNACSYKKAIRQYKSGYSYIRTDFIQDVDKILHSAFYNRYADKTQVFSFYKNDDITRRALHIQIVSRIARTIGAALNLNLDLIEAIALGHDIGHTPFGHAGEKYLNELYYDNTKRFFAHNLHSVRVLHSLIPENLTLPTLSGILSHNGEKGIEKYIPSDLNTFDDFDIQLEKSYIEGPQFMNTLKANSLEGCLVRICDMIAYVGKDRQDAYKAGLISKADNSFIETILGSSNAEIIHNLTFDIINNSYGHPYLKISKDFFDALITIKDANSKIIYQNDRVREKYDSDIKYMMIDIYNKFLHDLEQEDRNSLIFKHHINFISNFNKQGTNDYYNDTENNQIVVDYIASMTDDYFISLHEELFPKNIHKVKYHSYF